MQLTRYALMILFGALLFTVLQVDAQSTKKKKGPPATVKEGIVRLTKEKSDKVEKFLKALGPAVSEQLRMGKQVDIQGLGTFRIVRIDEYRDLVNGRPSTIPAKNYVEFVPSGTLEQAANAPGAIPARTVKGYEFRVNPNADPGIRTEGKRTPGTRIR